MVVNALVKHWDFKLDCYTQKWKLGIEYRTSCGNCYVDYDLEQINKLMKILDCQDIKELNKKPCVILLESNKYMDVGEFLFDTCYVREKIKSLSESWLLGNKKEELYMIRG